MRLAWSCSPASARSPKPPRSFPIRIHRVPHWSGSPRTRQTRRQRGRTPSRSRTRQACSSAPSVFDPYAATMKISAIGSAGLIGVAATPPLRRKVARRRLRSHRSGGDHGLASGTQPCFRTGHGEIRHDARPYRSARAPRRGRALLRAGYRARGVGEASARLMQVRIQSRRRARCARPNESGPTALACSSEGIRTDSVSPGPSPARLASPSRRDRRPRCTADDRRRC